MGRYYRPSGRPRPSSPVGDRFPQELQQHLLLHDSPTSAPVFGRIKASIEAIDGFIGAIDGFIGAIDGFIGAIDGFIGAIDGFVGAIDGFIGAIDGFIGAIDAFIDRVDATGIRVLVAARRQGRTVRPNRPKHRSNH
jgi:hypothetical protein